MYALIDSNGIVQNLIEWDGEAPYTPPAGFTAVPAPGGTCIGASYSNGIFTPLAAPAMPSPTPAQIAQAAASAALASGIAITSTSAPALNGTYPLTQSSIDAVDEVMLYIDTDGTFPGNNTTMAWPDASGALHTFPSVAEFKLFATAVANYVATVDEYANGVGSLPSNQVTIV